MLNSNTDAANVSRPLIQRNAIDFVGIRFRRIPLLEPRAYSRIHILYIPFLFCDEQLAMRLSICVIISISLYTYVHIRTFTFIIAPSYFDRPKIFVDTFSLNAYFRK